MSFEILCILYPTWDEFSKSRPAVTVVFQLRFTGEEEDDYSEEVHIFMLGLRRSPTWTATATVETASTVLQKFKGHENQLGSSSVQGVFESSRHAVLLPGSQAQKVEHVQPGRSSKGLPASGCRAWGLKLLISGHCIHFFDCHLYNLQT